ncbi:MAG TPA: hydrogen gas-evolving membrane-bound hydrogenase subunit E [Spirochaetia bacterium]|nr:hydrogen gas-evolving membrane-bound hydrogenase subunit E [Spirochaetia bacterium]
MIKRLFIFAAIILFGLMVLPLVTRIAPFTELTPLAAKYVGAEAHELGAANLVTAVVVTYRGLDTLGEVTVLFAATAGVGFLLRSRTKKDSSIADAETQAVEAGVQAADPESAVPVEVEVEADRRGSGASGAAATRRPAPLSELLSSASVVLFPLVLMFGAYIFIHGHLTPGGGFQGGVVIASGFALLMAADASRTLNHGVLLLVESLSGAAYVVLGLLGLVLAAGFLDTTFLPFGKLGQVFSAGAIPVIYSFVGLKVGSELTNILESLRK